MTTSGLRVMDPAVLDALAHPVRLDVLGYLISSGSKTASECARAVGDSPSNCSYHLRVLAGHGLVVQEQSADRRARPWRSMVTGFTVDDVPDGAELDVSSVLSASLQLNARLAQQHLRTRRSLPADWQGVEAHQTSGLLATPAELQSIVVAVNELVAPFLASTRKDAPDVARVVLFALTAFPRPCFEAVAGPASP